MELDRKKITLSKIEKTDIERPVELEKSEALATHGLTGREKDRIDAKNLRRT